MVERVIHNHSVVSSNLTIATWLLRGGENLGSEGEEGKFPVEPWGPRPGSGDDVAVDVTVEARKWKQNKFGWTAQRQNRGRLPRGSEDPEEPEEKERNQCKHDGINKTEDHELEMGGVIHQQVQ